MKDLPEREIQDQILNYLQKAGYLCFRVPVSGVRQNIGGKTFMSKNPMRGFPDILGFFRRRPGRCFCIEVKAKKGKLSAVQKQTTERLQNAGVQVIVARSVQTVVDFLRLNDV